MERNAKRALRVTAAIIGGVVIVLIVSGFTLQRLVMASFHTTRQITTARTVAFAALKSQLDEETGVRGFAATNQTVFLAPYYDGRNHLGASLARLDRILYRLQLENLRSDVADARTTNARWVATVALPVIESRAGNISETEQRGKLLIDRYRSDFDHIDETLDGRLTDINSSTARDLARTGAFIGLMIGIVVLSALTFFWQQARLGARLELSRIRAEDQRRRTAELRASYQAEKRIADTLQGAFAQRPLPTLPLLRFSATYVPATEETKVGGDWYDALELPEGRVLFAIGDVAGHGIEAAVMMNRARQALISSALLDREPAAVLARVNTEMLSQRAPMITAVAGFADAQQYEFVYASAGHPPPVLLEPGRAPRMLAFGSLPLGVSATASYRTHRIQSVPGALLVLYTDGAVEHSRNVLEGEELLLEATLKAARNTELDAASVIHNAIFSGRAVGDDVAILTIGFAADTAAGLTISGDHSQGAFSGRIARTGVLESGAPRPEARLLAKSLRYVPGYFSRQYAS